MTRATGLNPELRAGLVETFRRAWHDADDQGLAGQRTARGIDALFGTGAIAVVEDLPVDAAQVEAERIAEFLVAHQWPGEVLTVCGDAWACCSCGARIDLPIVDDKVNTGVAFRAHLVAAVLGETDRAGGAETCDFDMGEGDHCLLPAGHDGAHS